MLLATGWHHHGGVREPEPRVHLMEPGTYMRDASANAKAAGMSPLRLRVGVFLILLWIVPFWALAPYIADSLSGLSNPPSVAAVTTTIFVVQTIIGLLGSLRRRNASQVDHHGFHEEACPRGHLVDTHSRGYPRSGRHRQ